MTARSWQKNLRLSAQALWRSRDRTLLSASAMAVGIAAMVLLFGVGGGAERALEEALEEMGENLLAVIPERSESGPLRGSSRQVETLKLSDWQAINTEGDGILRAAALVLRELDLRHGNRSLRATVLGTTPEFQLTNNQRLAAGRFFEEDEVMNHRRVAVLGARVVRDLFFGEQPLGERLLVDGVPFTVVGVLREKGIDPTGADEDNRILIPVLTAQRRLFDVDSLDRIFVQAISKAALPVAEEEVRALLGRDDFKIQAQEALLATLEETGRSFSRLLAGLAVLTLGLGSVGLLAVSLLSVRERHSEIGLRLAVGAEPWQVLVQFLAETVMIAALGAVVGLSLGGAGIIVGEKVVGWRLAFTWRAVFIPFALSLVLALVFGAWPALRAARLDPIVALRSQ